MNLIAVIVTYEPEIPTLNSQIKILLAQVDIILVIDNNSKADVNNAINHPPNNRLKFKKLQENFGIAYAQNVGIQIAIDLNGSHVLLMDQDSLPEPDMVLKLKTALVDAANNCADSVAGAGPVYVDRRTGVKSFFVVESCFFPRRWHPKFSIFEHTFLDVSFLISSGTLISLDVIKKIGGMKSNYFIDHVDTEWCFRARAAGFRLIGVPQAQMNHALGDKVTRVWLFGMRHVAHHSPLRDYYMFRNSLLMMRDVKMTFAWQLHLIGRLLQFAGFFLVFAPCRRLRLGSMLLGIKHGLLGVSGKIDLKTAACSRIPESTLDIYK